MNKLEEKLELIELNPIERAYKQPTKYNLKGVPKIKQDEKLVKHVCSYEGTALKYVSKKLITYELCELAVSQNGLALGYVPNKFLSEHICNIAVANNGRALEYVPEFMRSLVMVEKAVTYYYIRYDDILLKDINKYKEIIERAKIKGERLGDWNKYPIAFVPTQFISKELLIKAVKYSPFCIRDIPKRKLTEELINIAVNGNGLSLEYVPRKYITDEVINIAVLNNPFAIQYAPKEYITNEIINLAVSNNPFVIQSIPKEYINQELCNYAFELDYHSFSYIPEEYINQELCNRVFDKDYCYFLCIPEEYITVEMCLKLIQMKKVKVIIEKFDELDTSFITFADFPLKMRNNKQIIDAIISMYEEGALSIIKWNKNVNEHWKKYNYYMINKRRVAIIPLQAKTVKYLYTKVINTEEETIFELIDEQFFNDNDKEESLPIVLQKPPINAFPVIYKGMNPIIHSLYEDENSLRFIYYISDIHIEYQLKDKVNKKFENSREKIIKKVLDNRGIIDLDNVPENVKKEINQRLNKEKKRIFLSLLNKKVDEMVKGINNDDDRSKILLIGGDVANSVDFSKEFYNCLFSKWKGIIISIIGNHELWDGIKICDLINPNYNVRSIEEIISDYREIITQDYKSEFLENELFIYYKNIRYCTISENDILDSSEEDLSDILSKCSLIILGGIGYSGLDLYYNAENGLYRKTMTSLYEDERRSEAFRIVYDKVNKCARNKRVIVLTHTPVYDWTKEDCNPNWVYINGHTHQNCMINEKNGATVFSDNQVGYKPQRWKLNVLTTFGWYDPFEKYKDGVYEITSEDYIEFNRGRGIGVSRCNYEGQLYALKRDGLYMFLFMSSMSLFLMEGGKRKKLDIFDIMYYYNNMSIYGKKVKEIIKPYQDKLEQISKEVKRFGGIGTIHGCIVDISWYSHIYLNPYDGKMSSYWALDISSRRPFDSIQELIERKEPELLKKFLSEYNNNSIPLIGEHLMVKKNKNEVTKVPHMMFGTEIYKPSNIMRSIQYVYEQNVIRIWNDDILRYNSFRIEDE